MVQETMTTARSEWITGFLNHPEAFYRTMEQTGGKPWPVLPLSIVCMKCRASVDIESKHCPKCGELFYVQCGPKGRPPKSGPKVSVCMGRKPREGQALERSPSTRQFSGGMLPLDQSLREGRY